MSAPLNGHAFGNAPDGLAPVPAVVLPGTDLFARRAARLKELAIRVPSLDEFLDFMARLVQTQQQVLDARPTAWQPAPEGLALALEHGLPPLSVQALRAHLDWQADLQALLDGLEPQVGERQRPLLDALRASTPGERAALGDQVLEDRAGPPSARGLLPLVAAALQIAWVRLARALPRPPQRPEGAARALCPSCGSPPVASVVHNEPPRRGVRYLQCSLCATEWHVERVRCTVCDKGSALVYLELDDARGTPLLPVQAEACGHCRSYLKVALRERHGRADPVADDLASLALDLLLAENGEYARSGRNPLLIVSDA